MMFAFSMIAFTQAAPVSSVVHEQGTTIDMPTEVVCASVDYVYTATDAVFLEIGVLNIPYSYQEASTITSDAEPNYFIQVKPPLLVHQYSNYSTSTKYNWHFTCSIERSHLYRC